MGGLTSGMPGFLGAASSAGADAASSAAATPRPEVGPFPTMSAAMTPDAGTKMPDSMAMMGLGQQLMKQFAPPAPTPSGGSILPPTAPVNMPAGPAGNIPLPLQQLLARRLGGGIIPQPRIPFDPSMFF